MYSKFSKTILASLMAVQLLPFSSADLCYDIEGNSIDSNWETCIGREKQRMCCPSIDYCLPNGLCNPVENFYYRALCSESSWAGPGGACVDRNICPDTDNYKYDNQTSIGYAQMTPCGDKDSEKWCCGSSNECCKNGRYVTLHPFTYPSPTPSSTASSSPKISTPYAGPTGDSYDYPSSSHSGLSPGEEVGISLGAFVGALSIAGTIFFLVLRNRERKAPVEQNPVSYLPVAQKPQELETSRVQEMPATDRESRHELSGDWTERSRNSGL